MRWPHTGTRGHRTADALPQADHVGGRVVVDPAQPPQLVGHPLGGDPKPLAECWTYPAVTSPLWAWLTNAFKAYTDISVLSATETKVLL